MATNDLDKQLDNWLGQVKDLIPDVKTKQKMTAAGGEVLKKNLVQETKSKHYTDRNGTSKNPHLADELAVDHDDDGNSGVGFHKKAYIARFLDEGTKYRPGDHFYEATINRSKKDVLDAMRTVYDKSSSEKHS
ncbi:HK97-gp10 family putative phage morphogenesis protein [Lactiplantibacillus paraxiangfangensis]|uniref:HK97-gp10 family putative phage morphogenesis protein n=1 Tax=Lactiplantibacillus paraxiangfangensis TaxID=3076224 RepID=UPI0030C705F7